jgi:hypothetical protein
VLSVPKRTPRILLDSDEYPECVETTPRVLGPVIVGREDAKEMHWGRYICEEADGGGRKRVGNA